ncbi:MAG: DUF3991 and toprim domain-containing protein [Lachnospiraceae bacterium]|nr:DUF3991 and toprim domain-containing protein [Ruminococcus sp.]MCM1277229.1 DUF3991 and toprim domain-containing protein [Lachnospiraceae bacterium]
MVGTYITDEMIEQARGANLAEYFKSNGYEFEQRRSEVHVRGYGGLYVNEQTNQWHCFSMSGKNGGTNAVNCLTDVIGLDFKTAVSELAGYSISRPVYHERTAAPPKKRDLVIPERADNMRKVFAYLCQTRRIDSKIVSNLAQNGLLYQDKRGNAVFVHRDESGKIIGAELQGTNSYQRFKGVAAGTSDSLFAVKIGEPNRAYVFESAIDLLSFRQLANPAKIQNCVLVSMAGLKPNSLKALSERGLKLYACVDNDEAGIKFTNNNGLIPCNRILAENSVKDFNELLQTIERNRAAVKNAATLQAAEKSPPQHNAVTTAKPKRR